MGEWEVCVRPVSGGSPPGDGWEPFSSHGHPAGGDRVLWRRRSGPSEAAQSAVLRDCVREAIGLLDTRLGDDPLAAQAAGLLRLGMRGQPSGSRVVADLLDVVDLLDRDGLFESPDWPPGHVLVRSIDAWRAAGKPGLPEVAR